MLTLGDRDYLTTYNKTTPLLGRSGIAGPKGPRADVWIKIDPNHVASAPVRKGRNAKALE